MLPFLRVDVYHWSTVVSTTDKLARLNGGVVEIAVSDDKTQLDFSEVGCGFNCVGLTKAEVLALAEELILIASTLK